MKVLIVGGGGREHALAWKCAQSRARRASVRRARQRGHGARAQGAQRRHRRRRYRGPARVRGARGHRPHHRRARRRRWSPASSIASPPTGARCFGPSRAAARLEGSKAFTKDFLKRHRIPTAGYATFTAATFDPAYVRAQRLPVVVKADGLAAARASSSARPTSRRSTRRSAMLGGSFGAAGNTVVIEEFLQRRGSQLHRDGERASGRCRSRRPRITSAATTAIKGPNTGGMGAYSPAPIVTPELHERIMREVIEPTLRGLRADGNPYLGFLYAGLMIAADGTPNVLEFNCRFGDPETQPILMRLQSDLVDLCEAALAGCLEGVDVRWDPRAALGVVMAAGGYPDDYRKGDPISGLDAAAALPGKVFHAGTARGRRADRDRRRARAMRRRPRRARRRRAGARPTSWCKRSTGTACSTGATSATAGSSTHRPSERGAISTPLAGPRARDVDDKFRCPNTARLRARHFSS